MARRWRGRSGSRASPRSLSMRAKADHRAASVASRPSFIANRNQCCLFARGLNALINKIPSTAAGCHRIRSSIAEEIAGTIRRLWYCSPERAVPRLEHVFKLSGNDPAAKEGATEVTAKSVPVHVEVKEASCVETISLL